MLLDSWQCLQEQVAHFLAAWLHKVDRDAFSVGAMSSNALAEGLRFTVHLGHQSLAYVREMDRESLSQKFSEYEQLASNLSQSLVEKDDAMGGDKAG
jgi:hypothetical protein